jgi:hypothetical protein
VSSLQESLNLIKQQQHQAALLLLKSALQLLLQVMCWDFSLNTVSTFAMHPTPEKKSGYDNDNLPSKIAPADAVWKQLFSDMSTVQLLMAIYSFARGNQQLAHLVRQCLIQFSSMTQQVFESDQLKYQYIQTMLYSLFSIAFQSNPNSINGQEVHDVAQALQRLVTHFTFKMFAQMPNYMDHFLKPLVKFTVGMIEQSTKFAYDDWIVECLDGLISCWSYLACSCDIQLQPNLTTQAQACKAACYEVFKIYLEVVLRDESNNEEDEQDEAFSMEERLTNVAMLGRQDVVQSMAILNTKLIERLSLLEKLVKGESIPKSMDQLWNDLEWILQLSGHVIADTDEGETPLIPEPILQLNTANTNMLLTLFSNILKYAEFEMVCLSNQKQHVLSPRISEKLYWFLDRWAKSYLMFDVTNYDSINSAIQQAFGTGSGGEKYVELLLNKIMNTMHMWQEEPHVVVKACHLFKTMVENKLITRYVVNTEIWKKLLDSDKHTFSSLSKSSDEVKRLFTECLLLGIVGTQLNNNKQLFEQQLLSILMPLKDAFFSVIKRPDFAKVMQQPQIMQQVQYCIEKFRAYARGTTETTFPYVFQVFDSFMIGQHLVQLIHVYHDYDNIVMLVLRFFEEFVHYYVIHMNLSHTDRIVSLNQNSAARCTTCA